MCAHSLFGIFLDFRDDGVFGISEPSRELSIQPLLLQINPRSLVSEKREPVPPPADAINLPYLADLNALLPSSNKQVSVVLLHLILTLTFLVWLCTRSGLSDLAEAVFQPFQERR